MKKDLSPDSRKTFTFLEEIFENMPAGVIVIRSDGEIAMLNRWQEKISRIERTKVIGTIFHETWNKILDNKSTENQTYRNYYWNLLKNHKPFSLIFHSESPQFYTESISGIAYGAPILSGKYFILVFDISEEIKTDKFHLEKINSQLLRSNAFLENLLNSTPNAVITTDKNGNIQTVNRAAEFYFGYSNDEFFLNPISIVLGQHIDINSIDETSNIIEGVEVKCFKKDGETFPARMQLSFFQGFEDRALSKLFIFRDISREKAMELTITDRLRFEEMISQLSYNFIHLPLAKTDDKIRDGLKLITDFLEIDLVALSQFDIYENSLIVTHVCPTGDSPFLLGTDLLILMPWYAREIHKGEILKLSRVLDELPEYARSEYEYFRKEKVKSHLALPVTSGDKILGALSFTSIHRFNLWNDDKIKRLKLVVEIFANVLMRKLFEESLNKAFWEIKTLKQKIEEERNYLKEEISFEYNFGSIIGNSDVLHQTLHKVKQVAVTDFTVLVSGETGTGKELIARAIHSLSKRKDKLLIKVNCAALPEKLIESELFGHEKGAFTGADVKRVGRFELADGATIFLDEIGELSLDLQAKLLRVIQEGEFERIGSSRTVKVDVRIIAATNRNLDEEIKKGKFREDLFYRLNVFPIIVPPLRQREGDIILLTNFFVNKYSKILGKRITEIPQGVINYLEKHTWPGNIRELENMIQRAIINSPGPELVLMDQIGDPKIGYFPNISPKSLAEIERDYITEILNLTGWRIQGKDGACSILDLPPSTLRARMAKLNIQKPKV